MRARAVFYRERFSRMYGPEVYGLAHIIVELPWTAFIVLSCTCILYFMVGFAPTATQFFFYVFTLWILTIKMLSLGQFAAAVLQTPEVAQAVIGGGAIPCLPPPPPLAVPLRDTHCATLTQALLLPPPPPSPRALQPSH